MQTQMCINYPANAGSQMVHWTILSINADIWQPYSGIPTNFSAQAFQPGAER